MLTGLIISVIWFTGIINSENERPIIGIPVMKITDELLLKTVPELKSRYYIAASYVKLVEMAGGRVVPILSNLTNKQLSNLFSSLNGLIFPGGETNLINSSYFFKTKKLYDLAVEANNDGKVFPILGICRGMQALIVHTHGNISPLKLVDSINYTASLNFTQEAKSSVLFGSLPNDSLGDAQRLNLTAHFHKYGIIPDEFGTFPKVKKTFNILATSSDRKNKHFISAIEGKILPFYGVQYHPEKVLFEWAETVNIPHSYAAIKFSQNTPNVFVEQARRNFNKFKDYDEERRYVISKRMPYFVGNLVNAHSPFVQIYIF